MAGKLKDLGKSSNTQTLYCPITHTPVTAEDQRYLSLGGEVAIWWHCPACSGWHVTLGPEVASQRTLAGQNVFSLRI